MVALLLLPSKPCEHCQQRGYRAQLINGQLHSKAPCPDCKGDGIVPADYFIEAGTADQVEGFVETIYREGI